MKPDQFVAFLRSVGASAILRTEIEEAAGPAMEAAVRGGFQVVEFTLTVPGAHERIAEFARREELVVGAGTVLTPEDARRAVAAGARFLVSPVVDEAVIETAHELGVAVMPGCHTPTEMLRAHRAGAQLQKLFPAAAGGAGYVRACRGPLPFLRIVPTHGVDRNNVGEYLAAGSHAVGFVAPVFDPGDLAAGRFDVIENRARALIAATARSL